MDTLMLSRVQLGSLTAFHLLFPAVTLTLGWVLVAFRLRGGARLAAAFGMWMPIYALTVAFQVVSGWALLTQFQLTMPLFSAQAGAVAGPLQVFYVFGNVLQVLPLSLAAWGIRSFNGATVTALIALSALGSLFSLLSPMILMSWMVDPVGTYTTQWTLGSADWLMLLLRSDVWFVIGYMTLASGATVGFLMACLSTFRWTAGNPQSCGRWHGQDRVVAGRDLILWRIVFDWLERRAGHVIGDADGFVPDQLGLAGGVAQAGHRVGAGA